MQINSSDLSVDPNSTGILVSEELNIPIHDFKKQFTVSDWNSHQETYFYTTLTCDVDCESFQHLKWRSLLQIIY